MPTAIHPVVHQTVNLSEDGIRQYVTAIPPRKKQKTRSKKLGEGREEGVEWNPAGDFEDDNMEAGDVNMEDFDMSGWKQYAPAFAMDGSGELVDDFSPRTGKRKRYDSSISLTSYYDEMNLVTIPFTQGVQPAEHGCRVVRQHPLRPRTRFQLLTSSIDVKLAGVHGMQELQLETAHLYAIACLDNTSLKEMGLVYQLGHNSSECHVPGTSQTLTILHVNGVHTVEGRWCRCDISDGEGRYRQLLHNGWYPAMTTEPRSVITNINMRDYMSTLEQKVDCWGTEWHLKRAGIGHLKGGLTTAEQGSVAILCWACPRDGVNLPSSWRNTPLKSQYLYRLLVGLDANFWLKNRLRHRNKNKKDVVLYSGLGYQVPNEEYFKHLKNYVNEKDISTCIAFAVLMQKDTCMSTGLRCMGVGGYANMDYIFWSLIQSARIKDITLSYDVGCQYKINLEERHKKLPVSLQRDSRSPFMAVALPIWHRDVHVMKCKTENLLMYQDGVGKSDGEGIERMWSAFNPMAWQMKEMHPEVRHDAIEDRIDRHNFHKNIGLGDSLDQHLKIALVECDVQIKEFQDIDLTLKRELKIKWRKKVADWRKDRSKPSPYAAQETSGMLRMTEAQVRLQLRNEELQEITSGSTKSVKKVSTSAFLIMGLELENDQCRIILEMKISTLTVHRQGKVHELRISFFKKLSSFCKIQPVYMPGMEVLMEEEEAKRDTDDTAPATEAITLWLPSQIPKDECPHACNASISNVKFQLREGQCTDALASLFRNANVVGQQRSTRLRTLINSVTDRIETSAMKYRQARAAMVALRGEGSCREFKKLEPEDVAPVHEVERDAKASKHLGRVGGRDARSQARPTVQKLMWIWMALGSPGAEVDDGVHKYVRVEWSKALVRKFRWCEEVEILCEEMQRTVRLLKYEAQKWEERAQQDDASVAEEVRQGQRAYAVKQAMLRNRTWNTFKVKWGLGDGVPDSMPSPLDPEAEASSSDDDGDSNDTETVMPSGTATIGSGGLA
ncbi:hypothetical protein EV421DRAFT_1732619 [Armillaria borealis]|uniref:CxC2-like cysteine cluster KDZ transposase-associated domain-containing protein n=1 Tax=Armillaria borealis TaxID=47425 RepID=A0AA39JUV0_9AGAR|nr:hypothetical protein EV421DRAFT_1732619 [Armillaria borealis]